MKLAEEGASEGAKDLIPMKRSWTEDAKEGPAKLGGRAARRRRGPRLVQLGGVQGCAVTQVGERINAKIGAGGVILDLACFFAAFY